MYTFAVVQRLVSLCLLLCLSLQFLMQAGVAGYCIVNKEYIARMLCVNRDKPALKCNGQCYLKKKMKQAAGAENTRSNPGGCFEKQEAPFFILNEETRMGHSAMPAASFRFPYHCHYRFIPGSDIFHPPSQRV